MDAGNPPPQRTPGGSPSEPPPTTWQDALLTWQGQVKACGCAVGGIVAVVAVLAVVAICTAPANPCFFQSPVC